jgi:hypothetical protein
MLRLPRKNAMEITTEHEFITTTSINPDMQMEKYIALRIMIAEITKTTNFITVFKTTYLLTKTHFYTYVFDLEKNDCTKLFATLLSIFRIQLYGCPYRALTKRYFVVGGMNNHYFFNHLHKLGITIYVFDNRTTVNYIKSLTNSVLDKHLVLRNNTKNKNALSGEKPDADAVAQSITNLHVS